MCHDINIHVKYNSEHIFLAALMISHEKHILLFDNMAALQTKCSWCVLEFARSNSIVVVQQQFGCHGSLVISSKVV
jgi:hypothetical protein